MDDKENRIDSELSKLSPFELKNRIIALADESVKKDAHVMLNAGRGNPNWIAPEPREAFIALSSFAIGECRKVSPAVLSSISKTMCRFRECRC